MTKLNSRTKLEPKVDADDQITKKSQLIKLLGAKSGADLKALSDRLGWQPHTTRAAMSGLRKAGYVVICVKSAKGGASKYRILSAPTTVSAEAKAQPHAA